MANGKQDESRAADVIKNWIRTRYTIEFLGTWEMIHNPAFNVVEFDHFRKQAGLPSFTLSVGEWIEKTNAIGMIVKRGRYGGTYAFKDIAFEFGTAISVPFKLYLIEEFQRLKVEEQKLLGWTAKRELSKINYRIHTDAILNDGGVTCDTPILFVRQVDLRRRSPHRERLHGQPALPGLPGI